MAEVKEMVIPLRAAWNVPRTKRANRAMAEIRNHVSQHMKILEDEEIWIDQAVNEVIWAPVSYTHLPLPPIYSV